MTGQKGSGVGWRLVFAAGCFPATAGLAMLGLAGWSATGGSEGPWTSLMGPHGFSAAGLEQQNPELYALWLLTVHLCGVNLAMSGVMVSLLSWFGLRRGVKWARGVLWLLILWVGVNDAAALVYYRLIRGSGIPYALIPLTLGSVGLWIAKREASRPDSLPAD